MARIDFTGPSIESCPRGAQLLIADANDVIGTLQ